MFKSIEQLDAAVQNLKNQPEELSTIPDPTKPFSFNLSKENMEWLRNFVNQRRKDPSNFHYNNSQALREGIDLLRQNKPVKPRPKEVKNPIRMGRPYKLAEKKLKTSFLISEADRNFIYDFIFAHAHEEDFFGKEKFLEEVFNQLEEKYTKKGALKTLLS